MQDVDVEKQLKRCNKIEDPAKREQCKEKVMVEAIKAVQSKVSGMDEVNRKLDVIIEKTSKIDKIDDLEGKVTALDGKVTGIGNEVKEIHEWANATAEWNKNVVEPVIKKMDSLYDAEKAKSDASKHFYTR